MNFIDSHIFREENQCADSLANVGQNSNVPIVWFERPSCINSSFATNKLGLPNYRFVHYYGGVCLVPLLSFGFSTFLLYIFW